MTYKRQLREANRTINDNAASLIERATGICMEVWFGLTHVFHAQADKYDPEMVNPNEKYMFFKLAPGGDSRDDAYKRIIDACESLCDKLNDALGRGGLFTPEIIRKDGLLEVRARYGEGQGGIFHAKTKQQDVGIAIIMTMPRQGVIRDAFKALITTPAFPIGDDDIPEPETVLPDNPNQQPQNPQQVAPEDKLSARGGVNVVGNEPVRKESMEYLKEGKKPHPDFPGPPNSREWKGYYVVYGKTEDQLNPAYAKWEWNADLGNGVDLPARRFINKNEAIKAKEALKVNLRKPDEFGYGDSLKGMWELHVKFWDGLRWSQTSFELDNYIPQLPNPALKPVRKQFPNPTAPVDTAPLSSQSAVRTQSYESSGNSLNENWFKKRCSGWSKSAFSGS